MTRRINSNTSSAMGIIIILFLAYLPFGIYQDNKNRKQKEIEDALHSQVVGDLVVPGTIQDAKKSGFTNCKNTQKTLTYECELSKEIIIEGISIKNATLELNEYNNFNVNYQVKRNDTPSPETLTYRTIKIHGDIAEIIKGLERAGWVAYAERRSTTLYKQGINAVFYPERFGNIEEIEFRPVPPSQVKSAFESMENERMQKRAEVESNQKIQDVMSGEK